MKISFQNNGMIDPRCITTIGVSVKESDNPIGFFGTGLKYAIAIILRSGGSLTIWRGLEPLRFDSDTVNIRDKDFQVVRMNGQELGFTTELGKHWKMWQAFREIYCNTIDEGGSCDIGEIAPEPDKTTIVVESFEFAEDFQRIGDFILQSQPVFSDRSLNLHSEPSHSVFYRSICVSESVASKPFMFAPDIIESVTLTEDRTLKDQWSLWAIYAKVICRATDKSFLEKWLTTGPEYAEYTIDLDWPSIEPSKEFLEVVMTLARDTSRPLNLTALKVLSKFQKPPEPITAKLLPTEQIVLNRAIRFCHELGYPVDEFPTILVESLGQNILGQANVEERKTLLAKRVVQMGISTCAATLIEEWVHIKHGFKDCDRNMQNWLFEQMTRLGEAYLYELNTNSLEEKCTNPKRKSD